MSFFGWIAKNKNKSSEEWVKDEEVDECMTCASDFTVRTSSLSLPPSHEHMNDDQTISNLPISSPAHT